MFTEREMSEIKFSLLYADEFNHGTDGHNAKLIIAKLYRRVKELENTITTLQTANAGEQNTQNTETFMD